MDKIKENHRYKITYFLKDFSNENIIQYKKSVPFVNVIDEFVEQWHSLYKYTSTKKWFKEYYSEDEKEKLKIFNNNIELFNSKIPKDIDVPKIFKYKCWEIIQNEIILLLHFLNDYESK